MLRRALALVALFLVPLGAQAQGAESGVIAITNVNVVNGINATRLRNATIVVRNGKIASITERGAVPAGARVIDAAGRWAAPGMIDAHTHIRTSIRIPKRKRPHECAR